MKLLKFNTALVEISRVLYLIAFFYFYILDISVRNTTWNGFRLTNSLIMFFFYCFIQIPLLIIIFYTFIEQVIFLKKIPNIWFKILFLLTPLIFMLITLKKNSLIIENEYIFLSYKKIMQILIWLLIIVSVGSYLFSMIFGFIVFNDKHLLEFMGNTHIMWLCIIYICVIPILFIILVQFFKYKLFTEKK